MMSIVAALRKVVHGHVRSTNAKNFANLSQKNISRTIDVSGFIQVSQHVYGDAARGCHHRGDGPDASQRVISNNRQRLGVLVIEGFAAIPVGSMEPRVRITGEGGYAPWQLRRRQRRSRQRRSPQRRRRSSYYFFFRLVVRSAPGFCGSPGALLFPQPSSSCAPETLAKH